MSRRYHFADRLLISFDEALKTLLNKPHHAARPMPGGDLEVEGAGLTETEKKQVGALIRVDHCGEVCAQGLYHGHGMFARSDALYDNMLHAANEENDHLAWCEQRLAELGSRTSYLNPLWYLGSFAIGSVAGAAGDRWGLAFVVETEKQVMQHLDSHIEHIPLEDYKTHALLQQMKKDEAEHAASAHEQGAAEMPRPVKKLMQKLAKVMTTTAERI